MIQQLQLSAITKNFMILQNFMTDKFKYCVYGTIECKELIHFSGTLQEKMQSYQAEARIKNPLPSRPAEEELGDTPCPPVSPKQFRTTTTNRQIEIQAIRSILAKDNRCP